MSSQANIQRQHAQNIQDWARDVTNIRKVGFDLHDFYVTNNYSGNPPAFAGFDNLNAVDLMTTYLDLENLVNGSAVGTTPRRRIWDLWVGNAEIRTPVNPPNADTDSENKWASDGIQWAKSIYTALAEAQSLYEFWVTQTTTATPVWDATNFDAALGRDGANPLYRFGFAEAAAIATFMNSGWLPYGNNGAVATADYKVNLGAVR